jgi:serine-type D-Ala-D-Ala carboxypeptidase/endopeptidase
VSSFPGRLLALTLLSQYAFAQSIAPDSEIRKILVDRIDTYQRNVGIVVGVIEPEGRRIVAYGRMDKSDPRPVGGETIFEIDSLTKVFTALLLADMVQRGEVSLDDPAAKYLPAGVKLPERRGRQITLLDLATHTSALASFPSNIFPADPSNPFADYTADQLYEHLAKYQLKRDIGSKYDYSNIGYGILGQALARRAGMTYEDTIKARITGPLGMNSTAISLSPEMKSRITPGHEAYRMESAPPWDAPAMEGAMGLRSTTDDLLTLLSAFLGYTKTPLSPAMAAMLTVRRPTGEPRHDVVLGWHTLTPGICGRFGCKPMDVEIIWHNGMSFGYSSYIGYDPKSRLGVVVLSNAAEREEGVGDIARHLLVPQLPLLDGKGLKRPTDHEEIAADPELLDRYAGRYKSPEDIYTVTRDGGRLRLKTDGGLSFEMYPEANGTFFGKTEDVTIKFETDRHGRAATLVLRDEDGSIQRAKRIT